MKKIKISFHGDYPSRFEDYEVSTCERGYTDAVEKAIKHLQDRVLPIAKYLDLDLHEEHKETPIKGFGATISELINNG